MTATDPLAQRMRGTAIAFQNQGLLLQGDSGSGKSSLAIKMIALGAKLISDDYVDVTVENGQPYLSAIDATKGLIEARGMGIISVPFVPKAKLMICANLSKTQSDRLPEDKTCTILGCPVRLIEKSAYIDMASGLILLLTPAENRFHS